QKCDQHHRAGNRGQHANVIPFHKKPTPLLALPVGRLHSTGRFLGKLTERWGRKASGLRDVRAYDSGVAGANVNALHGGGPRGPRKPGRHGSTDHPLSSSALSAPPAKLLRPLETLGRQDSTRFVAPG